MEDRRHEPDHNSSAPLADEEVFFFLASFDCACAFIVTQTTWKLVKHKNFREVNSLWRN
jgi:hypothetical protein